MKLWKIPVLLGAMYVAAIGYQEYRHLLPGPEPVSKVETVWYGNDEYKVEQTYSYDIPMNSVPAIQHTQNCMYSQSWTGSRSQVDEECVVRGVQKSAIKYCAENPDQCDMASVAMPGMVINLPLPRKDSSFFTELNPGK